MKIVCKIQKGIVVALASLMLVSAVPNFVEAAKFKDVGKTHWAHEYIDRVNNLGYMEGMSSDTFSPNGLLKFDEAIVLLGRFTNPTVAEKTQAKSEYGKFLKDIGVVDWAQEYIAVAMYKGMISEKEMKNVYDNNRGNKAITKVATSVYIVRAMELEKEAQNKLTVSLTYDDALEMTPMEMKHVSVLIDAGVLDPKGSGNGLFEPKSSLRRDIMAKMISTAHDYLKKNSNNSGNTDYEKPSVSVEKAYMDNVEIKSINDLGSRKALTVYDASKGDKLYNIMNDTDIKLDGKSASYSDLSEGQKVDLVFKKGSIDLISIKALSNEDKTSGEIKYINEDSSKLTVIHTVNKKIVSDEYSVDKRADIYLDGAKVYLKDLNKGDLVDLEIKNNVINSIKAKSKDKKIEGNIKSLKAVKNSINEEYNITVTDSDNKEYEFLINKDTTIYRKNKKVKDPTELKVNDDVYIVVENGVAVDIDAGVLEKKIEGIIIGMNTRLHQETEITIANRKTKKEETYILNKANYISIDKKVANSLDLKAGYYIKAYVEGNEITEIEADSRGSEATVIGKISHINTRTMEMEIIVESFDLSGLKYGDEIVVHIKSDAVIADRYLDRIKLSSLERDDIVNVIGSYDGASFIADTIQLR